MCLIQLFLLAYTLGNNTSDAAFASQMILVYFIYSFIFIIYFFDAEN